MHDAPDVHARGFNHLIIAGYQVSFERLDEVIDRLAMATLFREIPTRSKRH
jgi:hypothetical protein